MKSFFLIFIAIIHVDFSIAQVAVKDEPRHHNIFENTYVRILDVHIKPGDTTLYHIHNTPSVFVSFTNTKVGTNMINQSASSGFNNSGDIEYDSMNTPRIHRVWNNDTSWFHVIDVEIISKQPRVQQTKQIKWTDLLFDGPLVKGYKLHLNSGKNFSIKKTNTPVLLVSIGEVNLSITINAREQIRVMKAGHFFWIDPNEKVVIKALNNTQGNFAMLELK